VVEIVVRPYEERDEEGFMLVRSLTYNDGLPIPLENRRSRFTRGFVAEREGQIVGVYRILDLTCTREAALLNHGGVAGVAVLPEFRRSGVGSIMMARAIRLMREQGQAIGSLYGFRESWYRKLGYEVCGKRIQVVCPTHRLPKVQDSGLSVRRLEPADWPLIQPCFEAWAYARSGMSLRTPLLWERFLNEHKPNAIYAAGDPVEGYVALSHQVAFWAEQRLSEVVWSTERGYRSCLETIHQLGINKSAMAWYEPSDSPFAAQHIDQGVELSVQRPIMFRLTDVPSAFEALKPTESGEFTFEVEDEIVPENRGPWLVRFGDGKVEITRAGKAGLAFHIRHLTQAYLGDPSLSDLARIGLVTVRDANTLQNAIKLLGPMPVYCGEFF
jgi:predicted acetyltransferase